MVKAMMPGQKGSKGGDVNAALNCALTSLKERKGIACPALWTMFVWMNLVVALIFALARFIGERTSIEDASVSSPGSAFTILPEGKCTLRAE